MHARGICCIWSWKYCGQIWYVQCLGRLFVPLSLTYTYKDKAKQYILYMCANDYIVWTGSSDNAVASKGRSPAQQQPILQPPKSEPPKTPLQKTQHPRAQPNKRLQPITQPWRTQHLKPEHPEAKPPKAQQPTTKLWKRQPRETLLQKHNNSHQKHERKLQIRWMSSEVWLDAFLVVDLKGIERTETWYICFWPFWKCKNGGVGIIVIWECPVGRLQSLNCSLFSVGANFGKILELFLSLSCLVVTHYYRQNVWRNLAVLILESLTASVAKVLTASVANPDIRTSDYQGDYYAE